MPDEQRLTWHHDWLALDDQRLRHETAWCDINRALERRPDWFRLSDAEQAEAQRISGLTETERVLSLIQKRLDRSLKKMPRGPSRDYEAVLANLRVADRLTFPDENPEVSGLLSRAIRDMVAIRDGS